MTVTPDTIAVALGRTAPVNPSAEFAQWTMWIGDALMLIESRLGDSSLLNQDALDYVIRESVVAQVRRPDDATQVDIKIDDGSVGRTYRTSAGRVTIRDEWWDLLSPTDSNSGAFSIQIAGCESSHLAWCSFSMGANWCSCGVDIAGYPIFELNGP